MTVKPISLAEAGDDLIQVDLGQPELSTRFNGLLNLTRDQADSAYLLTWQGDTRVRIGSGLPS